ncbi:MAG: hypothetical protein LBH48_04440 [Bifidobacteriaceae bacterium]|nr:hypothetical protein [Bifidobacteriaceae bacterium]
MCPAAARPGRPAQPWEAWPLGSRVVVRYHLEEGGYSDALGTLLAVDPDALTVATRRGTMTVPTKAIAIAKLICGPNGAE